MKIVKKFFIALLMLSLITFVALADVIQLDFSTATDAELIEAIDLIRAEQIARYKEKLANQEIAQDTDGITFRGIPWYSTIKTAESKLDQVFKYRSADSLRRLSYTNYSGVFSGKDIVDGKLGCNLICSGLNVAGYAPSSTVLCYVFPLTDGQIVRDFELAQMYMGYYSFESSDYADLTSVYSDLSTKLEKLYGTGKSSFDKYFTNILWLDEAGNKIRLQIDDDSSCLSLAYVASTADERLDEMGKALLVEQKQQEEEVRQQNVNNTDGL